jgi:hypothetical protein
MVKAVLALMDQEGCGSLQASKIRPGLLQERSGEYGLFFGSLTLDPVLTVSRKRCNQNQQSSPYPNRWTRVDGWSFINVYRGWRS